MNNNPIKAATNDWFHYQLICRSTSQFIEKTVRNVIVTNHNFDIFILLNSAKLRNNQFTICIRQINIANLTVDKLGPLLVVRQPHDDSGSHCTRSRNSQAHNSW